MEEIICKNCGLVNNYRKKEVKYKTRTGDIRSHLQAICNGCDEYIKNLVQTHKPQTFIPFGKYKGYHTYQIDDVDYMRWLHSVTDNYRLKIALELRMRELNSGVL